MFSLFDTQRGEVTQVRPGRAGLVRLFACGPRVGRYIQVGDLRSTLVADLIRRNGERQGLSVLICQPVDDVGQISGDGGTDPPGDDSVLTVASAETLPPFEVARLLQDAFRADCAALNIAPPDYAPRTSESVGQVVDMISRLIATGHAYQADSGSAYFDAASFPGMPETAVAEAGAGPEEAGKRSAADWPLWSAGPSAGGLTFDAPWGAGLPTWHAACSALSLACLGGVIDVHTGDVGQRSGHDEKERAQSDAVAGREVVRHWVHSEVVRSENGGLWLAGLADRGLDPLAARLAFLERSYREPMSLTWHALTAADIALREWREFVADCANEPSKPICAEYAARIFGAFDHDLDTPAALRALRELAADDQIPAGSKFETFAAADRVIGLDLVSLVGQPRPDHR